MAIVTTPPKRTIEDLRSDLTDKLGELHRRAVHAKEVVAAPTAMIASPLTPLAIGAVVGLIAGTQLRGITVASILRGAALLGFGVVVGEVLRARREPTP